MNFQHLKFNIERPRQTVVAGEGALEVGSSMLNVECFSHAQSGSVLIIVLWVAIGLVSIALYFANTMTYELRAADNRVSGLAADQAIEGAARYVSYVLQNFATNGAMPATNLFVCEAVPVGDAHFWLIGRDPSIANPTEPAFGLIDEESKLSLNTANTNVLSYLPNMTADFAQAIIDWRGTNGTVALDYASLGYLPKNAPFETADELRLVYGATIDLLVGDDPNRNGVLDANEKSSGGGDMNYGLLEYSAVDPREPNFHADGSSLTNLNTASQQTIQTLLQADGVSSATAMATSIYRNVHSNPGQVNNFNGILDLAVRTRNLGMSAADFTKIYNDVTTGTNAYFRGRININTADADVLTALFMGLNVDEQTAQAAAQTLMNYREQNAANGNLNSVGWLIEALGSNSAVVTALQRGDYVTTKTYQFTADIAAVGAFGRGYRRVKFIFDTSNGTPIILYRQDLSRLGWALGERARQTLVAKATP